MDRHPESTGTRIVGAKTVPDLVDRGGTEEKGVPRESLVDKTLSLAHLLEKRGLHDSKSCAVAPRVGSTPTSGTTSTKMHSL
jgi:hypothetical protein